jgi:hypothetical protein
MDEVLELGAMLDQVKVKARLLALAADSEIGQPDRRQTAPSGRARQDLEVDLV